jgi:hypothetical protein
VIDRLVTNRVDHNCLSVSDMKPMYRGSHVPVYINTFAKNNHERSKINSPDLQLCDVLLCMHWDVAGVISLP